MSATGVPVETGKQYLAGSAEMDVSKLGSLLRPSSGKRQLVNGHLYRACPIATFI
jgi:hypothetical protein